MRSYVVVLPLAPLQAGAEFRRDAWPPHVTLIPPFETDAPPEAVLEGIRAAAQGHEPVPAVAGPRAGFGRRGDVPVTTIEPSEELEALHVDVLGAVDRFLRPGVRLSHVGPGNYRPHVTDQHAGGLEPGASVTLAQLAVVDMRPEGDARRRRVVAAIPLGGAFD
ncbi:2'-5' RNA ligase family protein [Gryllotalpicola ginsengisoli]|uniref:2'-5' RNA ligase family protein n=1 Tax=Gryllotalpicola ginsengisoli TaxID=444608 RepID=UPI0003B7766B|nr:2'-5' RNA ligase family protein [Gryllotalpicola ginsengisoli]